ncbi:hypothetical protein AOLI_G00092300 [Acnodon oligacanthus]
MLQQNNNNNSLCLDMAHRELLQGCGRSSAPLSFGAIGFGAIPLIKGLRAWAVSGGFNARNRRKTAGEHQNRQQTKQMMQRGWKTKENLTFRTPGALVTVATLKGSEGVRQTQTRCLFLKAEGCSYLCTPVSLRLGTVRMMWGILPCYFHSNVSWDDLRHGAAWSHGFTLIQGEHSQSFADLPAAPSVRVSRSGSLFIFTCNR